MAEKAPAPNLGPDPFASAISPEYSAPVSGANGQPLSWREYADAWTNQAVIEPAPSVAPVVEPSPVVSAPSDTGKMHGPQARHHHDRSGHHGRHGRVDSAESAVTPMVPPAVEQTPPAPADPAEAPTAVIEVAPAPQMTERAERTMSEAERRTREVISSIPEADWHNLRQEFDNRLEIVNNALGIDANASEFQKASVDMNARVMLGNIVAGYGEAKQKEFTPEQQEEILGIMRNQKGAFNILINSVHAGATATTQAEATGATAPELNGEQVTQVIEAPQMIEAAGAPDPRDKEGLRKRFGRMFKSGFNKSKDIVTGRTFLAWVQTQGVGRNQQGEPIIPAVAAGAAGGALIAETEQLSVVRGEQPGEGRERRRGRRALVGALIGAGIVGLAWGIEELLEKKGGMAKPGLTEHLKSHVDLTGIRPNTIHAHTPAEFQNGVVDLLSSQGVHLSRPLTPSQLEHMNQYMQAHGVASGMKYDPSVHHNVQNVVDFPQDGAKFPNTNASADQGFIVGPDSSVGGKMTGKANMDGWVRELEKVGAHFTRINIPRGAQL